MSESTDTTLQHWWELVEVEGEHGLRLVVQPTAVFVLRIGRPGEIWVYDKKAKVERLLTVDDLVRFWCQTATRRIKR